MSWISIKCYLAASAGAPELVFRLSNDMLLVVY